jgi:hypothetical protein
MTNETNRRLLSVFYVFLSGEDKKEESVDSSVINNDLDEESMQNIRNKNNQFNKFSQNIGSLIESKDDQNDVNEAKNIKKFSTFNQDAMGKTKVKKLDANSEI